VQVGTNTGVVRWVAMRRTAVFSCLLTSLGVWCQHGWELRGRRDTAPALLPALVVSSFVHHSCRGTVLRDSGFGCTSCTGQHLDVDLSRGPCLDHFR
jgi:hypothetical protein